MAFTCTLLQTFFRRVAASLATLRKNAASLPSPLRFRSVAARRNSAKSNQQSCIYRSSTLRKLNLLIYYGTVFFSFFRRVKGLPSTVHENSMLFSLIRFRRVYTGKSESSAKNVGDKKKCRRHESMYLIYFTSQRVHLFLATIALLHFIRFGRLM